MTLVLTITLVDKDNPSRGKQKTVEVADIWAAMHELRAGAGPAFIHDLSRLSWEALNKVTQPETTDP